MTPLAIKLLIVSPSSSALQAMPCVRGAFLSGDLQLGSLFHNFFPISISVSIKRDSALAIMVGC